MVEIKKIVLQLGEKEVELTIEEAKKLKETLNELFGTQIVYQDRWYYHYPWQAIPITTTTPNYVLTTAGTNYDPTNYTLSLNPYGAE